jgi:hypothetical protein
MNKRKTRVLKSQKKVESVRPSKRAPVYLHEQGPAQLMTPQASYRRISVNHNGLTSADLLTLQRTVGNRQVQRILAQRVDSEPRIRRAVGNRAAVGLVSQAGMGLPMQRMQDVGAPSQSPMTAMKIPGEGKVIVKNDAKRLEGKITGVLVKKQISQIQEAEIKDPHLKHWWFLFNVSQDNDSVWMQVDLNLNDGYRIIWDASTKEAEGIGYYQGTVPSNLTSKQVEDAVAALATSERFYNNPKVPNPEARRYSCQDFVTKLASSLNIVL